MRQCLAGAEEASRELLSRHRGELDALVEALLKQETLTRDDVNQLFGNTGQPAKREAAGGAAGPT